MGKHLKQGNDMIDTESLKWIHRRREKKRTKDDELEAREHLHEGSPDQNID